MAATMDPKAILVHNESDSASIASSTSMPSLKHTSSHTLNEPSTASHQQIQTSPSSLPPLTPIHSSPPESEFKPSARLYLAFLVLCTLTLMVALDGTSLSVALPIISRALNGSALEAFWAGTGFLLASTVFQPNYASFSHIFGRVPIVLTAVTFFLIGTLVAGLAHGFGMLLAGRVIQGIGGGGIIAMTEVIITDLVPLRLRGQWAGLIGGMWAIGSVTGPVIGGTFAQKVTWRWVFWLNLPFIGLGYIMIPLFLRLNLIPGSLASKLRRIDWFGSIIFVSSTAAVLIPITWGGIMYPWSSWHTLLPLLLGLAGLTVFIIYELKFAAEPVIRLSVFANRTVNIAYISTVLHGMILWCLLYYQPLYFEGVRSLSPIMSGVALFPATFTVAPMSIITGLLITKLARYRWSLWLGWAITTTGLALWTLITPTTPTTSWVFIALTSGVGLGILFPALQFQVQAASSNADIAFAVAMFSFFRALGQTLGVAIGGVIFQNQMTRQLARYPQFASRASELAKDAAALVTYIASTTDEVEKAALKESFTASIRVIYVVISCVAGVAFVLNLWGKEYSLDRAFETSQGLVVGKRGSGSGSEEEERGEKVVA